MATCICFDISEKNGLIDIFCTVIRCHVLLMLVKYHLAVCDIYVIMAICCYILCVCCNIVEKNGLSLFTFGTVINQNGDVMHVQYILVLC